MPSYSNKGLWRNFQQSVFYHLSRGLTRTRRMWLPSACFGSRDFQGWWEEEDFLLRLLPCTALLMRRSCV